MASQPFEKDEKEFLKAVGLNPNDLEKLVAGAPPASADAQARIRERTRAKLALEGQTTVVGQTTKVHHAATPKRNRFPRWAAAAAAVVVAVSGTALISGNQSAQAALDRLLHLVPGLGLKATEGRTLVLAGPVSVKGDMGDLTVLALISTADYTEVRFRVDGVTLKRGRWGEGREGVQRATLVMPDGREVSSTGTTVNGGESILEGTFWFPAVPADVQAVTLYVAPLFDMTGPFTATLPLVDIESAGLVRAQGGGWSVQHQGVLLGAPYVASHGDRIAFSLDVVLQKKNARIEQVISPELRDNLGNIYPLDPQESVLSYTTTRGLEAAFDGPLPEGATSLRLTVPYVQVLEDGEARLSVPLVDLPAGQSVKVNQELQLGDRTFTVRTVTRLAEDRFSLDLDLGTMKGGQMLQHLFVKPSDGSLEGGGFSSSFKLDPQGSNQAEELEVRFTPKGRYLDLRFSRAVVLVEGPWEIELPIR